MKDEMNFDDFEKFLQSEVETQKMYPSDYVWNNIAKQIQPKKSWPALTFISIGIVLTLGIATFFNYPPENLLETIKANVKNKAVTNKSIVKSSLKQEGVTLAARPTNVVARKIQKNYITTFHKANNFSNNNINALSANTSSLTTSVNDKKEEITNVQSAKTRNGSFIAGELASIDALSTPDFSSLNNLKLHGFEKKKAKITQEKISDRLAYEIYATPSISFRKLAEDEYVNKSSTGSVNNQVSQKAGIGKEIGIGLRYKISNEFTFKTGLQFNIREYFIDAYSSNGLATIDVFQNNKFDSINVISKYGNGNGFEQIRLTNRLYQISIPIGVEWNVLNTKRFGLSIGASMQPTYSLNKNVFIISTDYKYYANGESLFRKWNINSSLNANFTYTHNKSTFYIGPQIRYQHLPTYVDKYPIKEYRVDYGIRLGIIKSIK